jgi:hypothetical protein
MAETLAAPATPSTDRRSECRVCGVWTWPRRHVCQGLPLTPAALDRWLIRESRS